MPTMRWEDKLRARELRVQGCSYNDILREVGVSKSTLSLWLRDIPLTDEQVAALSDKFRAGREKFIHKMRVRRDDRWAEYHREAEAEYAILSQDPAFMFGLALYIGEGTKSDENAVCFTNCDPRVICKALDFFLTIGVPYASLRGAVHLHPGLSVEAAELYWRQVTNSSETQLHKTSVSVSRASTGKKGNSQPRGTFQISATHTKTRQKLSVWMTLALAARSFIG